MDFKNLKINVVMVIVAASISVPAIVGYAIFINSIKVEASKGARAAKMIPKMYWDIQQIKKAQGVKDEPMPEYLLNMEDE